VEKYEAPKLTEYATIEEWTQGEPILDVDASIIIG
jgi:hypothetical protein